MEQDGERKEMKEKWGGGEQPEEVGQDWGGMREE